MVQSNMNRYTQLLVFALFICGCAGEDLPAQDSEVSQAQSSGENQPPVNLVVQPQEESLLPVSITVAEQFTGDWDEMKERGVVRILVPHNKTDYRLDNNGDARGIQADYIKELERIVGEERQQGEAPMVFLVLPVRFNQLIPKLLAGYGDIAAALFTITPEREELVDFAGGSRVVDELLVTSANLSGVSTLEDLIGQSVYVLAGSSYLQHLNEINDKFRTEGKGQIEIVEADANLTTPDILEMVNAGIVDATVVDDFEVGLWAEVLPDITVHQDIKINEGGRLGWAIRKNSPGLASELAKAGEQVKKGTLIGNMLFKRNFQNTQWIKNPLQEEERAKLIALIELFQGYGDQYEFDFLALAAQAYQESRLDHSARSSAGAVGIMQLLPSTAADPNVGIPNIEDLEANIHAGAKYMAFLRERYFSDPDMSEENKFAFTWASYNAGPARVRQMRARAIEMGLDPDIWFQNVEYAALEIVGLETVRYVANIYKYYIAYRLVSNLYTGDEA